MTITEQKARLDEIKQSIKELSNLYGDNPLHIVSFKQNVLANDNLSEDTEYMHILQKLFEANDIKTVVFPCPYNISVPFHDSIEEEKVDYISKLIDPIFVYTPSFKYFISYIMYYPDYVRQPLKSILFNGSERSKLFSNETMDSQLTSKTEAVSYLATDVSENIQNIIYQNSTADFIVQSMIDKGIAENGFNKKTLSIFGLPKDELRNIEKTKDEYNAYFSSYISQTPRVTYINNDFLTTYYNKLGLGLKLNKQGHYLMALNTFYHILDQKTGSNLAESFQYSIKPKNN